MVFQGLFIQPGCTMQNMITNRNRKGQSKNVYLITLFQYRRSYTIIDFGYVFFFCFLLEMKNRLLGSSSLKIGSTLVVSQSLLADIVRVLREGHLKTDKNFRHGVNLVRFYFFPNFSRN